MKCKRTGYISNVHEDGVVIFLGVKQMVTCSRAKTTVKELFVNAPLASDTTPCRQMLNMCDGGRTSPSSFSSHGNVEQEASSSLLLPVKTDTSFMKCAWRKALAPRFPRAHVELKIIFIGSKGKVKNIFFSFWFSTLTNWFFGRAVRKRIDFTRKVQGDTLRIAVVP